MSSLSNSSTLLPPAGGQPAPHFTRATVCCGSVETAYARTGRGDTIVVLAAPGWRGTRSLLPALARDFRLIVPDVDSSGDATAGRPAFAVWLSAFLDGLGLSNVTLLADERYGAAALGSALIEPIRVCRLVVVLDAAQADQSLDTTDATLCRSGTKVFVTWLGTDDDASADDVAAVLLGGRRSPG